MTISGRNVGVGITGSFCTFSKVTQAIRDLTAQGATVLPIFSYNAQSIDSRFGTANYWLDTITQITGKDPILTIPQAEPLGPKNSWIFCSSPPVPAIPWPNWPTVSPTPRC